MSTTFGNHWINQFLYEYVLFIWFLITGILDGHPAKTKAGELSIVPKEIQILAPCMKILPTTGLVDQSFKYRHRHVDLMLNPQVRSIFYTRSKIVNSIRQYLNSEFLNHSSAMLEFLGQGQIYK